jgi:DNA-binding CsgD family transcriptional regulator
MDDDRPVLRTLAGLHRATGVPLAFGGSVVDGKRVRLTEFAGETVGALRGIQLAYGHGLGGKVVALRRPVAVNDYVAADRISHHYDHVIAAEGLRAMVAVPVVVQRRVRAVLYGAIRSAVPLGDRTVRTVLDAARDLEQELAIRDEVGRRLAALDQRSAADERTRAPVPSSPRWEAVREVYADLRALAQRVDDIRLRDQVDDVCAKLAAASTPQETPPAAPILSGRELDVLSCVALGQTNPEAATQLGLGTETVKSYLRSAMRKLGAHTRWEAVVAARRLTLLP